MRDNLTIVKVGGNVVEEEASLKSLLKDFSRIAGNKILVHGGGKTATILSEKLGLESVKVEGRRITDAEPSRYAPWFMPDWSTKTLWPVSRLLATTPSD